LLCVRNPFYPNLSFSVSGWLQGKGMQQSPTSERAYQRVILLVDAVVATSRRHWSIHDPGVATFTWRGCSIPGNDYQKATRGSRDGRNPAWRRFSNP
ncbi:hypothetical protein ALC62_02516, partial [Cyphomyrmex costatus]